MQEKVELAYAMDFFGIMLSVYSYKYDSIYKLRKDLITYAHESNDTEIEDLINYLIPDLHHELQELKEIM